MNQINDFLDGKSSNPQPKSQIDSFLDDAPTQGGALSDLGKSLKVGVQKLPGMVTGLADLPVALATGARPFTKTADAIGEATGFQPGKWADETKFSQGHEDSRQQVDAAWDQASASDLTGSAANIAKAYLQNPAYTLNQVAESAPSMVAGGAASKVLMGVGRVAGVAADAAAGTAARAATPGILARTVGEKWAVPVAAGAGEGAVTAGQQMEQYQGDNQQLNALASLGAGAGTGLIGVGAGRLANKLGLETAETAIAKIGTKATAEVPLSLKRRVLGGMVSEAVLQELPQSAQEQMWQNFADGKPVMEGVGRAGVEGALAGGVMGAGANISGGRRPAPELQQEVAAEQGDPLQLGYSPLAGTPTVFPDGSVALNGDAEMAHRFAQQPVQTPSQAMGLDPTAGPMSAAAAQAVDSGAYMPPADQAVPVAPEPDPVVLQNRDRTSAASIAQMQDIAANPDYLRVGPSRDMTSGAPVVFGELPTTALLGRPETVVDGKGERMGTQYAVVDAGDLIASNNADGTTVSEYATGGAGKLRSVAGNGRTAGLQAAYQMGTAGNYRQELAGDAAALGMDPQAIAAMQRPVLVRVMQGADVTNDMGDRTNITATQKLSPLEQAGNDARRLDVRTLAFDESGSPTPDSIKGFVSAMPVAERGDMLNADGTPTRQAVDRLMAATFKQAYDSDELVQLYAQATDPDARAVMAAAADASGVLANLKGTGEFDVRAAVADAAKMAVNATRQGLKLSDVIQNADMDMNPEAFPVAAFMAQNIRTPRKMAEGLRRWGQLALEQARIADENTRQGGMFGAAPTLTRQEIFARLGDGTNPAQQGIAPKQAQADLVQTIPQSTQSNLNGDPNGTQADQAQQAGAQPAQAGSTQDAAVERHQSWRKNAIQAGRVARELGLEPKGKRLAEIVAEVDAADAVQSGAAPLVLERYTADEVLARQEAQEAINKAKLQEDTAHAKTEQVRADKAEVDARMNASAENFQLGQDASDAVSGQRSVFDAPAATAKKPEPAIKKVAASAQSEGAAAESKLKNKQSKDQTQTEAFKKWFGDSQVVDAAGKPLVVYHGTPNGGFATFDMAKSGTRASFESAKLGAFFSALPRYANAMARDVNETSPTVYPVYLRLENPLRVFSTEMDNAEETVRMMADAKAGGHDGIIDEYNNFVVFRPEQIKSAIGNNGDFDLNNPDIRFSRKAAKADTPSLIVQHNLSIDNLMHSARMGGIPVPSLAITKADHPLDGFGEITLLGDRDLADPKGYAKPKVFGADIYSPRYPQISHIVPEPAKKAFNKRMVGAIEATNSSIDFDEVMRNGAEGLRRSSPVVWQFLKDNGMTPTIVRKEGKPLPEALQRFKDDKRNPYELADDPAFVEAVYSAYEDRMISAYDGDVDAAKAEVADVKAKAEARGVSYLITGYSNDVAAYQRSQREAGAVDQSATRYAMDEQVRNAGLEPDLKTYSQELLAEIKPDEKIFKGFSNSGNRQYTPHTLDNVVAILKKDLRGGESFNYGVGSLRAKFTPQFKSIADIKKSEGRLMDKEAFEKVKKEIDDDFMKLAEEMAPGRSMDAVIDVLTDAPRMGLERSAKDLDIELTDSAKQHAVEFLERLRHLPTAYFEAKVLRSMDLAEFKVAIVPDNIAPAARKVLQDRGVQVVTYPKGDEAARARIIKEQAEKQALMFSTTNQNPATGLTDTASVRDAVAEKFPELVRSIDRMIARGEQGQKGGLVVIESADARAIAEVYASKTDRPLATALRQIQGDNPDVQHSDAGDIQGFYDPKSGLQFIVAPNVTAQTVSAVVLHEAVHGQQRADLDAKAQRLLDNRYNKMQPVKTREFLTRVAQRIEDSGEGENIKEVFPYIVEQAVLEGRQAGFSKADGKFLDWVDSTLGKAVGNFVRDLVARIRASALKRGFALTPSIDDLVALAKLAVRTAADGTVVTARPRAAAQAFSRSVGEQVDTPAFKAWYGDWQNAKNGKPDTTGLIEGVAGQPAGRAANDTGRADAVHGVQRPGDLDANHRRPVQVGAVSFPGASGPVGEDSRPVRFYHGTRDDVDAFKVDHANRLDKGWLGRGVYATNSFDLADSHAEFVKRSGNAGPNTMPLFMAVRNPYVATNALKLRLKNASQEYIDRFTQDLKAKGHDGVAMAFDDGHIELMAFEPTQVKSAIGNNGNFDPTNPDIRFSRTAKPTAIQSSMGSMTPAQEQAYQRVTGTKKVPTLQERADSFKANLGLKLRQGIVDQFAAIKQLDQKAYMQARMSKGSDGTLEAALLYGKPFLRDGVPDVDIKDGGFAKVLGTLKGEHDRFLTWVAAQRAERLKVEGKENLMTSDDISALKTLNAGKMADGTLRVPVYAKALQELNAYNDAVLKMAMESGLIDQAAYDLMAGQPYVPFYRLMEEEDGMKGPRFSSGLTNQKAWEKLKGGTQQLNADLLQNMLMNWSHLYQAAARNRAALATMDAAEKMAVAYPVQEGTKGAIKVMRDGQTQHWAVEDPYLLEAISALNYTASPLMKPLSKMKQILTWGVTVNPTFKIRNLIRDSVSAIAQSELGYNPAANVAKGWKLTASDSQIYASMLASGGVIKFGTQENTDRLRAQVKKLGGVVLDKNGAEKLWDNVKTVYGVYAEFGDRTENANRAALYDTLIKKGHSHAEASFMARDLMDFSMGGSFPLVRFLTQTVPFLNARLVGLDKLGRAAVADPRKFAAVTGAVALASVALLAMYSDDEDWKKREDWDRDSYWWFKIGGTAYRIPKPFEVGAIGTLAERTAELVFSKEMTNKRFMERMGHMLAQTFAFDPVPQAIKPLLDIYANKDSFTGRAIESQSDQRLRPQDRYNERTSEIARLLGGWGLPDPAQLLKGEYAGLSPKQVDHLMRGYFSWIATTVTTSTDLLARPVLDRGERPGMRLKDAFIAGNFVESLPTGSSRYVTQMYEQSRQVEQAYASYREAIQSGDKEKARRIQKEEAPKLLNHVAYANATKQLSKIGREAKSVEADRMMTSEVKRQRLNEIEQRRGVIAKRVNDFAISSAP